MYNSVNTSVERTVVFFNLKNQMLSLLYKLFTVDGKLAIVPIVVSIIVGAIGMGLYVKFKRPSFLVDEAPPAPIPQVQKPQLVYRAPPATQAPVQAPIEPFEYSDDEEDEYDDEEDYEENILPAASA